MGTNFKSLIGMGFASWNQWRIANPSIQVDLTRADLRGANLGQFNLEAACLHRANLEGASLWMTNLARANLTKANLRDTNLRRATLVDVNASEANISRAVCWKSNFDFANLHLADFWGSDLSDSTLRCANLTETRLHATTLVRANLEGADLSRAMVYGSSAWDANLSNATQRDLVITPDAGRQKWHGYDRMEVSGPVMTVDDLEVAQFVYMLVNNANVRRVIDVLTSKVVVLLGRFTPKRKSVLDALRETLRSHGLVPILFDFEKPSDRDFTETVATLAHLARFIIADLTDPRSVPQELQRLVPQLPSVPVQPIIQSEQAPYSMFPDFGAYLSVLPLLRYRDAEDLCCRLAVEVIKPAQELSEAIAEKRVSYAQQLVLSDG